MLIRLAARKEGFRLVDQLLELHKQEKIHIVYSPLLAVEALGQTPGRKWDPEIEGPMQQRLDEIVANPRMRQVELDHHTSLKARALALEFRLETCDAIHLASALAGRADVFFTFDEADFKMSEVDGMWVGAPYLPLESDVPGQSSLFDAGS